MPPPAPPATSGTAFPTQHTRCTRGPDGFVHPGGRAPRYFAKWDEVVGQFRARNSGLYYVEPPPVASQPDAPQRDVKRRRTELHQYAGTEKHPAAGTAAVAGAGAPGSTLVAERRVTRGVGQPGIESQPRNMQRTRGGSEKHPAAGTAAVAGIGAAPSSPRRVAARRVAP